MENLHRKDQQNQRLVLWMVWRVDSPLARPVTGKEEHGAVSAVEGDAAVGTAGRGNSERC